MDASGQRHKGVLHGRRHGRWQASYEKPPTYDYRGYTVCKAGPWSQGPVFLQGSPCSRATTSLSMDTAGPDFIHTLVEAKKLAYADRDA